jgi:hypothetical protein
VGETDKGHQCGQIKKSDGQTIDQSNHLAKDHDRIANAGAPLEFLSQLRIGAGSYGLTPHGSNDRNEARRHGLRGYWFDL